MDEEEDYSPSLREYGWLWRLLLLLLSKRLRRPCICLCRVVMGREGTRTLDLFLIDDDRRVGLFYEESMVMSRLKLSLFMRLAEVIFEASERRCFSSWSSRMERKETKEEKPAGCWRVGGLVEEEGITSL